MAPNVPFVSVAPVARISEFTAKLLPCRFSVPPLTMALPVMVEAPLIVKLPAVWRKLLLTVRPLMSSRFWLTRKLLMKPAPVMVPDALVLVRLPPVIAPPAVKLIVPLLTQSGTTLRTPVAAMLMAPLCVGAANNVSVPLLAASVPELISAALSVPTVPAAFSIWKPEVLVTAALLWYVPPASVRVPRLTKLEVLVRLLFSTRIVVPVFKSVLIEPPPAKVRVAALVPATAR